MNSSRELTAIRFEDDEIFNAWIDELVAEMRRRRLVAGIGVAIDETPAGTVIHATGGDGGGFVHLKTTSSPLPVATSVTQMKSVMCERWTFNDNGDGTADGVMVDEVRVWNKNPNAGIAANTHFGGEYDESGKIVAIYKFCTT